jgi:NAD(P)-dependent dehydrogenase (short-subunit alcohol dehydrogenase family)
MAKYLVFAASSGIGQAVVQQLKQEKNEVLTTARTADKITPDFTVDASDFDAVEHVFESVGPIDGVVNCAGSLLLRPAHLTTAGQFDEVIVASLKTAFAVVRAAGKYMRGGGSVVLVSSAAAMAGYANHEAIASAKAGIIGLVRSAAATYASQNLRFNAVAPGLIETPLTQQLTTNPAARKISEAMHALGRIGSPEDIARAICFLLDTRNSFITGQVIAVDGGLSMVHPKVRA